MPMTFEEREAFFQNTIFPEMMAVGKVATREYSRVENIFDNFERLAEDSEGKLTREQVVWILLKKHLDGIRHHVFGFRSQREPVQGRIKDAMVYLGLLWAMVEDTQAAEVDEMMEPTHPSPSKFVRLVAVLEQEGVTAQQAIQLAAAIRAKIEL